MRRISIALVAAVVALAAIPIYGPDARAADKAKLTVETDWSPHGMIAALLLAKQKGWFDEAGLDVDVLDGHGSNPTIQQVAAGQIDIGFAQLSSMAAGISNGLPVISIMGIVQAGDIGLIIPADSGWKTLKDLKGKRIIISSGAASTTFLDAFLQAGGVSRKDFQIISVDPSASVSTYSTGGGDALLNTASTALPLVQNIRPSKIILFSDVGLLIPGFGLIVRKDMLDKRADAFKKFVEVQQRTWAYIFAGHEQESIDAIMAQRSDLRLDPKLLLGQLKVDMPYFTTAATKGKPLGTQAASDWQSALDSMRAVDIVKTDIKPSDVFTNRFIGGRYVLK